MNTEDATPGDSTAVDVPLDRFRPCRFCQEPVKQPKRKDTVKDFCTDRHRAAFRDAQVQHAMRQARNSIQEAAAELSRLAASLEGSLQLLARYERKPRKEKK